jgi:hypothetical protein
VGLGLAAALAAAAVVETLTVNLYFHMLFRICLHLKVRKAVRCGVVWVSLCVFLMAATHRQLGSHWRLSPVAGSLNKSGMLGCRGISAPQAGAVGFCF